MCFSSSSIQGYYRKGVALQGLGRLEESLKAYLQCLMLNSSLCAARKALAEVGHESKVLTGCPQICNFPEQQHLLVAKVIVYYYASLIPTQN